MEGQGHDSGYDIDISCGGMFLHNFVPIEPEGEVCTEPSPTGGE